MQDENSRWADRASTLLTAWVGRLPPGVRRFLPRDLAGFAVLGTFTFGVDLALLAALRHWTPLPLAAAVSIAYLTAFGLNFTLNRTVNFRSHAPAAPQALRYTAVLAGDYALTVGASTGLAALGLPFPLARLAASALVAAFTYSASRWWVFRDRPPVAAPPSTPPVAPFPGDLPVAPLLADLPVTPLLADLPVAPLLADLPVAYEPR